ncbi:MAG: hypothetical protein VX624_05150, partial [Pseudomonadota bacterium]|nr:hypothetical protein [Pseudomonadota bacterium]
MQSHFDDFKELPGTAEIYSPGGALPKPGDLFVQADLGRTLQFLVDEEKAASRGGRDPSARFVWIKRAASYKVAPTHDAMPAPSAVRTRRH